VLSELSRVGISLDYLAGFSSAAPIILAHFAGLHTPILEDFTGRLDANKKNFYWFKRPHFPQDRIYGGAVHALVHEYRTHLPFGSFAIYGAATNPTYPVLKSLTASFFLLVRYGLRINLLPLARWLLGIEQITIDEETDMSRERLARFIMGSSSLYPYISHYRVGHHLILEGALLEVDPIQALSECEKKIIIHTERGKTGIENGVFHIYASEPIPENILDYTNGDAIRALHAHGKEVAHRHLLEIKDFLSA
jgi:hypothetical protein